MAGDATAAPERYLPWIAERLSLLYPDVASVRRLLALAGVDGRRVAMSGHAADTWWAAVVEAAHQARLRALVEAALEEYPQEPYLAAIHTRLDQSNQRGNAD